METCQDPIQWSPNNNPDGRGVDSSTRSHARIRVRTQAALADADLDIGKNRRLYLEHGSTLDCCILGFATPSTWYFALLPPRAPHSTAVSTGQDDGQVQYPLHTGKLPRTVELSTGGLDSSLGCGLDQTGSHGDCYRSHSHMDPIWIPCSRQQQCMGRLVQITPDSRWCFALACAGSMSLLSASRQQSPRRWHTRGACCCASLHCGAEASCSFARGNTCHLDGTVRAVISLRRRRRASSTTLESARSRLVLWTLPGLWIPEGPDSGYRRCFC